MTTKTITKPKLSVIKPQVWGCVFYVNSRNVDVGGALQVGPDEYMPPERYPTEESADEAGLKHIREMANHCPNCALMIIFGLVRYLRAERLE